MAALEEDRVQELRNTERLGTYFRLDARYSYTWPLAGGSLRIDLAVTNLTDRENRCCLDVEPDESTSELEGDPEAWTGIAPYASVTWQFGAH